MHDCGADMRRSAHRTLVRSIVAACLLLPVMAVAQPAGGWYGDMLRNRPWQALQVLGTLPGQEQAVAQLSVIVGDAGPACRLLSTRPPRIDAGMSHDDALREIVAAARDAQVVMLNESHFSRTHRLFLGRVLEALGALGFDALAAEAFEADAPALLADGDPDVRIGFYTADPAFAAVLRRARVMGWEFVAYEAASTEREQREEGQARALADWLERHPGRRLLVYAGGSHISEDESAGWMAARLKRMTGIDPLTIAQAATACAGMEAMWPFDASVAVTPMRDGRPSGGAGADIVVLHPPASIAAIEADRGVLHDVCIAAQAQDTLLRAFHVQSGDAAIAADQVVIPAGATRARLRLAQGRYRIMREDAEALHLLGSIESGGGHAGCIRLPSAA